MLWALRPPRRRQLPQLPAHHRRGSAVSGVFWIAGGLADGGPRLGLWAHGDRHRISHRRPPACGCRGSAARRRSDWDDRRRSPRRALRAVRHHRARRIAPGHRRHLRRHGVGPLRRRRPSSRPSSAASRCGPIYFNIGAERASHHIATSDDPGRLGAQRLHLPAPPDRGRHHRLGGGGRARARPIRTATPTSRRCW